MMISRNLFHGQLCKRSMLNLSKMCGDSAPKNRFISYISDSNKWVDKKSTIIVGAVAYGDNVSSIWEGMRKYYARSGVPLDFMLFTSYERQLEYLLAGHIDIAWNGPVAHARLKRLQKDIISLGMRDSDRDFVSYILATKQSGIRSMKDIENKKLCTGSYDSPQAYLLPMHYLASQNVDLSKIDVIRYDKDIGKISLKFSLET